MAYFYNTGYIHVGKLFDYLCIYKVSYIKDITKRMYDNDLREISSIDQKSFDLISINE